MTRNISLLLSFVMLATCGKAQRQSKAEQKKETLAWTDILSLGLEGQGYSDLATPYDRLPERMKSKVSKPVWKLSEDSAGLLVRFDSNTPKLKVKWWLRKKSLAMPHMPATGVSGVDLYVRSKTGKWQWLACGRPWKMNENEATLFDKLPAQMRQYMLYLPLYNGISKLLLGVPEGAKLKAAQKRPKSRRKPIVFFGTSITQGGCASRPGMVHTAIVGRRLDYPIINLGFSGQGRMQLPIGGLLGEIDARLIVIDCLPNLWAQHVRGRFAPFIKALRAKNPKVPILLVEDRTYSNAHLRSDLRKRNEDSRKALHEGVTALRQKGVTGLHYLKGEALLGTDSEGTVDGSHPTDLGFWRQAGVFESKIREILEKAK